jgi:hypothetical protein
MSAHGSTATGRLAVRVVEPWALLGRRATRHPQAVSHSHRGASDLSVYGNSREVVSQSTEPMWPLTHTQPCSNTDCHIVA